MKYFTGILFFLLLPAWLLSQEVVVKDIETGERLENATLMSNAPEAFATTDEKGKADVSAFQGAEEIVVRMLGYKTQTTSFAGLKKSSFSIEMEPRALSIDEVVVSASRWRQSTGNIPSKVVNINPEEIQLQNPQTAADLLEVSGKVFVQKSQQGGGSPMIRGFATNRLLYTIDGVRMNTAIFRSGNIQNVISLDPFAIESTEILFGPGSVIYGSDAIGGVMSFQTLQPEFSDSNDEPLVKGNTIARYATANNEQTGHFDVKVGWKKWALVTSFSANDYDDLKMGSNGPDAYLKPYYVKMIDGMDRIIHLEDPEVQKPSGYTQQNLMQKVRYKPREDWDLEYGFHYSETSSYGRFDRTLRTRNHNPRYGQWDYGPQKWMMNNLSIAHKAGNQVYDDFNLRLAHQYFEESRIDRDLYSSEQRNRIEEVNAYSINMDFSKSLNKNSQLYYGAEWVLNDVNSIAFNKNIYDNEKEPIGTRYPDSDWSSYALYISGQFDLSDKTALHAGARYNHFAINATFDTVHYPFPYSQAQLDNGSITGNVGLTHRPTEDWVIKGNLSTGFRSPNIDDIGKVFDSEPGAVVVPNPDLEAEYAYNADLGIARIYGDWLKLDVTAFYTHLDNAMVRRNFTLDGLENIIYDGELSRVQALQNAASAFVYGLQVGAEAKLPGGFSLTTDFNFQEGEEELDDGTRSPSRHAAPWFGTSRITYRANGLFLEMYAQYSGEVAYEDLAVSEQGKPELYAPDGNGNHYSPSWYTLNLKASYQISKSWKINAGMENLTDQRYRPYSSGIAAPGRNFILSLSARF